MKLRLPIQATFLTTNRCNLTCSHCYTSANTRHYDELDTVEWKRAVDLFVALPVFQLYFGGGEHFLRRDSVELINYARSKGLVVTTSTNGYYVTDSLIQSVADGVHFQVSIDGFESMHDEIRGSGSFQAALHAARLLQNNGRRVGIGTVATRSNHLELPRFFREVVVPLAPALWHVLRLQPVGRGAVHYEELGLSNVDWVQLVKVLKSIRLDGFPVSIDSSYDIDGIELLHPNDAWYYWRDLGVDICVWPNGNLSPSDLLHQPEWCLGNICQVNDLSQVITTSPQLRRLLNAQLAVGGKCTTCRAFDACRGGSRTVALALTGDITAPDPFCPHEPPGRYAYDA